MSPVWKPNSFFPNEMRGVIIWQKKRNDCELYKYLQTCFLVSIKTHSSWPGYRNPWLWAAVRCSHMVHTFSTIKTMVLFSYHYLHGQTTSVEITKCKAVVPNIVKKTTHRKWHTHAQKSRRTEERAPITMRKIGQLSVVGWSLQMTFSRLAPPCPNVNLMTQYSLGRFYWRICTTRRGLGGLSLCSREFKYALWTRVSLHTFTPAMSKHLQTFQNFRF